MRHAAAVLVLTACLFSPTVAGRSYAGPFEDATDAYNRGDYKTAFQLMKPLADEGNASAQYDLGLFYQQGKGVQQDYNEAVYWYRKAAEQGDTKAQRNLGFLYDKGFGVVQDYGEAASWYRKAAEQGDGVALYNLGGMYFSGRGVPQDQLEAAKWYREAAEQGNALAPYNLGVMYVNGEGVAKDYVLSYMWLSIALSRLPASETDKRNQVTNDMDRVTYSMTPAQIAEAQRLAREWKSRNEK